MEIVDKREPGQKLYVKNSDISESEFIDCYAEKLTFQNVSLPHLSVSCANLGGSYFNDICFAGSKITDANLSDFEIDGAQMGGAYIHNIGMPPEGHPAYDPNRTEQRPLKFESCNFKGSTIHDCDLRNVAITHCDIDGLTIDGIDIAKLIEEYKKKNGGQHDSNSTDS